ncbi:hypothetical protein DFJ77DRAFT_115728 [Powellomyces hirtus]|nr:hypothetical protein DFJ77DRAFT_115728 [Powellomyces hirtus]
MYPEETNGNNMKGSIASSTGSEVTLDILPTELGRPALEWEPFAPLRVSPRIAELGEPFLFVLAAAVYGWLTVSGIRLPEQLLLSTAVIPGFILLGFAVLLLPFSLLELYIEYRVHATGKRRVARITKPIRIINPGLKKASNAAIRLGLSGAAALCAGYGRSVFTAVLTTILAIAALYWYAIGTCERIPGYKGEGRYQKPIRVIEVKTGQIVLMKKGARSYAALPSAALINAERNEASQRMRCACVDQQCAGTHIYRAEHCVFSTDFGVAGPLVCVARAEARFLKCKYLYVPRLDDEGGPVGYSAKRTSAERKALIDSTRALRFKNASAVIIPILGCSAIVPELKASLSQKRRKLPWYRRLFGRPWFSISQSLSHNLTEDPTTGGGITWPTCETFDTCWQSMQSAIDMQCSDSSSLQELMYCTRINIVVCGTLQGGRSPSERTSQRTPTGDGERNYCRWVDDLHRRLKQWRSACAGSLYSELVRRSMKDRSNESGRSRFCLRELADIHATRGGWIDLPLEDSEAFLRLLQAFSVTGDATLLLVSPAELPAGLQGIVPGAHCDSYFPAEQSVNAEYSCILRNVPEFDEKGQRALILVTAVHPLIPGDSDPETGVMRHNVRGMGSLGRFVYSVNPDARWYISPTYLSARGYLAFQMIPGRDVEGRDATVVGAGVFECPKARGVGATRAWNVETSDI